MFIVYVIKDRFGNLYKGQTNNLERRLWQHNNGLSGWTKGCAPFEIVYTKTFKSKGEALKFEKYLKSGHGRDFLKTVISGRSAAR